jgi:hypothetical protein
MPVLVTTRIPGLAPGSANAATTAATTRNVGKDCSLAGHWSSWQAARMEVEQEREAKELARNPLEHRVLAKLVDEIDVRPSL